MINMDRNVIAALVGYGGYLIFLLRLYCYFERPLAYSSYDKYKVR